MDMHIVWFDQPACAEVDLIGCKAANLCRPASTFRVPPGLCLTTRAYAEVAQLARSLEATMGWPVDLECAYRDGTLYLLQCRPITTLRPGGAEGS